MLITDVMEKIEYRLIGENREFTRLEYDSKKVEQGDIFCCIVGTFLDGHSFAAQAVESGAVALLTERELDIAIPQIIVKNSRIAMAEMAANLYGHPSKGMTIVGVTGTNGKTSTTYMLKAIAEENGKKVGIFGTIRNMIGDKRIDTEHTTPESVDLQRILRQMKDENVDIVLMEVSSHSLSQHRVHGIEFEVGIFTNLTQDHLDYHKTFEAYIEAKKQMFKQSRNMVVNIDDAYSQQIITACELPLITYGISKPANIYARDIEITNSEVHFKLSCFDKKAGVVVPIPGLFSVYNALGAVGASVVLGYPLSKSVEGIRKMSSVSGRLEPLPTGGHNFTAILDYAHTPDALENILKTVREFAKGRIVTLFGCGGDRDKAKRPIMGEIAGRFSDFLVITSDNPRSEDPLDIISAILEGVKKSGCENVIIENRRDAIEYALKNAKENDVIVIAGKGHENYQEIKGKKHHFDDKEIVAELIAEL